MSYYLRLLHWPAVGEEPVNLIGEIDGYRIFEIPPSFVANTGIKIQVKGQTVATYHHFAIDGNGIAYVFDAENEKLLGSLGECEIFEPA